MKRKKERRGGSRQGSGAKPKYSEQTKNDKKGSFRSGKQILCLSQNQQQINQII